ncbi:ABC transporter ATP-binding protein [Terrabacter aerolatus]|uniref:ABC transporter permease n=2 Tax=Terrabacter aerolatus TaxID=422442 RepID=A0A512D4Z0_9MICO|nr:ABC transporter permease [Terrabacter aerolatus]
MNQPNAVVTFTDVNQRFGAVTAVEELSLRIGQGERLAILGRTGAGKSTLLNLLIGNLRPTRGTVRVDGLDPYAQHAELQGVIGMAFQTPRLLPWRTALDNVAVGMEILGVPQSERLERARTWLGKMHLADSAGLFPSQLSGGMRQRVSLARAFSIEPALVLLDESFSALDEVTARQLREEFVELAEAERKTALIVTHNIEEAFAISHRVLLLGRPARILAEYAVSDCPAVGTTDFGDLRRSIHQQMVDATRAAMA